MGYSHLPYEEIIYLIYTKTIHDLTNAIVNKCFEFQNDWLKIVRIIDTIPRNFILYHSVKGIKNFEEHRNF